VSTEQGGPRPVGEGSPDASVAHASPSSPVSPASAPIVSRVRRASRSARRPSGATPKSRLARPPPRAWLHRGARSRSPSTRGRPSAEYTVGTDTPRPASSRRTLRMFIP